MPTEKIKVTISDKTVTIADAVTLLCEAIYCLLTQSERE